MVLFLECLCRHTHSIKENISRIKKSNLYWIHTDYSEMTCISVSVCLCGMCVCLSVCMCEDVYICESVTLCEYICECL